MANIILPPGWQLKENQATTEAAYRNRRTFLKTLGLGAIGLMSSTSALACASDVQRSNAAAMGRLGRRLVFLKPSRETGPPCLRTSSSKPSDMRRTIRVWQAGT